MKSLAIVSYTIESVNSYYNQIKSLFSDKITIKTYTLEDLGNYGDSEIKADVLLFPSYHLYKQIKSKVNKNTELLFAHRTISKSGLDTIFKLDEGSEVVLIDESPEMAEQIISIIYQLGARHIELNSFWTSNADDFDKFIILGQSDYTPKADKEIINIGNSLLDINSIIDIGMKFDLLSLLDRQDVVRSYKEIRTANFGFLKILGLTNSRESQLDILMQNIDAGVIGVNNDGNIFLYNENAKEIVNKEQVLNKKGSELFPEIPFDYTIESLKPVEEKIIKINGYDVVVSVNPLLHSRKMYGAVAIIRRYSDLEKKEYMLRKKLIGKGYTAKYNFDDIFGESDSITETKNIAKRMSKSNSSILITGETGTGKELFAQAIHNNSLRKEFQFVPVNCGAFPESLLESELFGYEEGAFTGARKGGKPGLFELAHNGTLFLDEITEMPMSLQVKLLRVLQEREVVRLGGDRIIDVDIRIIAATNKNIKEMVENDEFREDLYYRLNVLPLKIPPLRSRREDILGLVDYLKKSFKSDFILTDKAKEFLVNYSWKGNVRELRNCVEYLVNLGLRIVEEKDIPVDYSVKAFDNKLVSTEQNIIYEFLEQAGNNLKKYIFVLEELMSGGRNNQRLGRRTLSEIAKNKDIFISEQEIRTILLNLEKYKMAEIYKGRSGTVITEFGKKAYNYLSME
ncbi:sigma 54-interacting transcriptional regulator [Sedimentibacter hydroxybenzoicus DSM 7310]|uniref:Sigma 54-interacting transcriptional regulator n=2 Tax=Sedimentibacter hydroxybenzoicus TaxID=29345 RepID=A0A974GXC1_SEDHY|nr:sigma 54-interacting transcriptional regulator [Sedimentibacter hydroxybenzoicus DSM 7310]